MKQNSKLTLRRPAISKNWKCCSSSKSSLKMKRNRNRRRKMLVGLKEKQTNWKLGLPKLCSQIPRLDPFSCFVSSELNVLHPSYIRSLKEGMLA